MESRSLSFKELKVWKKSRELRKEIAVLVKGFPKDERFLLVDQMKRASRSITANIAEGHGRFHFKENIKFCLYSRGSASEMIDHLTVAVDEEYIDQSTSDVLEEKFEEVMKMLNGYIRHLHKKQREK
ncbi:MAG: four helix bundle protein [Flavobacteriales bacterium]|nr:four helix bundle protein [Flavobacteriales bacterium]